jgi:hypothetical protein
MVSSMAASIVPVCTPCDPEPTPEVDVRGRDPQVAEEDVGEHRVVVLPGVNNHMVDPGLSESGVDRG